MLKYHEQMKSQFLIPIHILILFNRKVVSGLYIEINIFILPKDRCCAHVTFD